MEKEYLIIGIVLLVILVGFVHSIVMTQKCKKICERQNNRTLERTEGLSPFDAKCICRKVMKDKEIKYFEFGIDE